MTTKVLPKRLTRAIYLVSGQPLNDVKPDAILHGCPKKVWPLVSRAVSQLGLIGIRPH
jgi:hypothetical protein